MTAVAATIVMSAGWTAADAAADEAAPAAVQAREEYAYSIGVQAYLYGYPLVEMYRVRDQTVFNPENPNRTPPNHFRHRRELLDAKSNVVVAPNNDTLYSSAWLDLSQGPVVLDVPDTHGRYYVMQFMDFYSNNFAYVGKRTTGTGAGSYVVVGPNWSGALPAGVKVLHAPTNAVWLLGRTLVDGPDDLAAVHALQDRYLLTPLAAWRHADAVVPALPVPPRFSKGDALDFFALMNVALTENPPPERERGLLALFARIGVGIGKGWDSASLDAGTAKGLRRAVDEGQKLIMTMPSGRPVANGWLGFSSYTGRFGDDYFYRAYIARFALAANDPAEAHNFTTRQDGDAHTLNGGHRYVLRFEPGQLPPVDAFWSLTMYELPKGFFVANGLDRYALGDRSKNLQRGADGSLEIYVQHDSPGPDKESNWLPAPEGDFELALRCYLPSEQITSGRWKPPAVHAGVER